MIKIPYFKNWLLVKTYCFYGLWTPRATPLLIATPHPHLRNVRAQATMHPATSMTRRFLGSKSWNTTGPTKMMEKMQVFFLNLCKYGNSLRPWRVIVNSVTLSNGWKHDLQRSGDEVWSRIESPINRLYLLPFEIHFFFWWKMKKVDVSKNRGTPKWMVYTGKSYQNGCFGGTTIFGNTHVSSCTITQLLGTRVWLLAFCSTYNPPLFWRNFQQNLTFWCWSIQGGPLPHISGVITS